MINFVLPYGEEQHFYNWVSITIHESWCTHFVQEFVRSSIYIIDILRIDDLRIDDQSSILRSSIYTVTHPLFCCFFSFFSKACSNKVWWSEKLFIQLHASVLILALNLKGLDLSNMKQHQSGRFDWDENTLFGKMLSIWGQRKRVSQESFQIFHSGASTETFTIYFHFFSFHFRFP